MNKRMPKDKLITGAYILQPYAQTEEHVREMAQCGIEMIVCLHPKDRGVLDLFEKYHLGCVLSGNLPGWWGGDGANAGTMHEKCPLSAYEEAARVFADHPAVWGVDIGDEPSAMDFDHYGKVARTTEEAFVNQFAYLNLYPSYASVASNTEEQTYCQLGTATYADYIERYIEKIDLPYICYDFYPYPLPEPTGIGQMFENYHIVADACRRTGRDFWYVPQVNGLKETDFTSLNMLRFQAYTALCYGASALFWACYTGGWWHNNVLDTKGNKTEQYDKLKVMNAELHAIGDAYMKYRNVSTHLLGYEAEEWMPAALRARSKPALDAGFVRGLKAGGAKLAVGEMVGRADADKRALFLCNTSDPYDKAPSCAQVTFSSFKRSVKVYSGEGAAELRRDGDDYSFSLPSGRGVLVTFD